MNERSFRDYSPHRALERRPMTDVTSPFPYSLHRLLPVPAPHRYIYISFKRHLCLRTRHPLQIHTYTPSSLLNGA